MVNIHSLSAQPRAECWHHVLRAAGVSSLHLAARHPYPVRAPRDVCPDPDVWLQDQTAAVPGGDRPRPHRPEPECGNAGVEEDHRAAEPDADRAQQEDVRTSHTP